MQLALILAVLAALASAEYGPAEPVGGAARRLLIAGAGMAAVTLLAWAASLLVARRLRADCAKERLWLDRFQRLRRFHLGLWLGTAGGILYCLQWGQLVRGNWRLDHAFLVDKLLVLAPVLLPLVLSWAAFYEVDRAVRAARGEGDSPIVGPTPTNASRRCPVAARKSGQSPRTRSQYLAVHVRHYLGLLLVPVLALLALRDGARLLAPCGVDQRHEPAVLLAGLAMLLLLFPLLLRTMWITRPLEPGPLRSRLEKAAARWGFRARDILVWHTGGMVANAAVAGLLPRCRYVFLTDALLARLTDDEIEAVFGHEVGHVRHHHLLLRVLAMLAPLGLCWLWQRASPESLWWVERMLLTGGLMVQTQAGLALVAATAVYLLVVFGYYARLLEHQADLFACRLPSSGGGPSHFRADAARAGAKIGTVPSAVAALASALEKLAACNGTRRTARGWQHASIARRIGFLGQIYQDPKRNLRFQRQVLLLGGLVMGVALSPLVYWLLPG